MRARIPLLALALAGPLAAPAVGQAPRRLGAPPIHPGLIQGGSLERWEEESSLFFTYRATGYRPRGPGVDVAVGTLPRWVASRVLVLALDGGLAQGARTGPLLFLLRGGAGGLLVAGRGVGSFVPALQAGLAVVAALDRRTAVRLDLGRHYYFGEGGGTTPRWSVGLGLAVLPRPPSP